ncbi:MAG TPA: acyl-CoA dehydrogenase family protein, partial [Dehalococcoidia bacterium]|nr:acyl-CoA dehydrogenase family protein [Dehalococcoidia bacterium]
QFRAEVRAWLAEHVPQVDGDRDSDENYEKYRQLGRELGAKGWLRPAAPVEYGGGGLPVDHAIVIAEEVDRYDLRLPPYYDSGGTLGGASILVWGTEEQKRRMLPPIFRGEVVTWQLLTGPEAGSDLAGTTTDARRDGDEYVLNGEKVFVGGSHGADFLWTIARTDATGERHRNLSWFLIPADLPGIQYRRMELLGDGNEGIGSGYKNTIYFDNVRVPAAQLVGGENNGWQVASTHLELEHGAGGRIGSNRLFRMTREWARQLKREGRPLIEHPDVQERLVDVFVQTEVTRLLNLRNYWMNQSHQRMSYEGPQASYYGKMAGLEVSQAMMDIIGPYALTTDEEWDVSRGLVEPYLKSAIVALHPGGTADIQKVIIARRIGVGRDIAERAGDTGGQAAF